MAWDVTESLVKAQQAVQARIVAQWIDGPLYRTPIQFPAVLGLVDVDKVAMIAAPPTNAPWLKVDVITGDTEPFSRCGDHGMNVTTVIVQLTIYAPRQKGLKQLLELGGLAKAIFSRKFNADGLQPGASSFRLLPDEKGWIVGMVRTPIDFFEQVAV